ncbi:hypothetical protein [Dyadobacter sp. NIV53]|uniref:hypothetical protein n=1 Tax=Dyadobacter sp. NIV53 TaxID=2861765 RepID=UPI001C86B733|nr:hypothetical protein [Dyadobacter sp. NIV53]
MKRLLLIFAFLSIFVKVQAQKIEIDLSAYATKAYVDSVIKAGRNDVIVKVACKRGPTIGTIDSISTTSLKFQFDADGVDTMSIAILSGTDKTIFSQVIAPKSNTIKVSYPSIIPAGNYKLVITGVSCKGTSNKAFIIPNKDDGGVTPDPVEKGTYVPVTLAKGMDEHLNLKITKSDSGNLLSDVSNTKKGDAYEYRYMIGAEVFTSETPFVNYQFGGHNPLRVLKFKMRRGVDTNHWDGETDNPGDYYSSNAGESFSYNTTAGFQTLFYRGPQAETGFLNHIPQSYQPEKQNVQWADIVPDMQLPKGHVWISAAAPWGIETVMKKGVTHISNYQLPWETNTQEVIRLRDSGLSYNDVPRTEVIMNLPYSAPDNWVNGYNLAYWPHGALTNEEAIQKGNEASIDHAVWIGETMEQGSAAPPDSPMWNPFYTVVKARYKERFGSRNIPYYICHNYFMFWPGNTKLGNGNTAEHSKLLLTLDPSQFPYTNFSPGGSLSSTNLIVEAVYLNAPDIQQGQIYETIYRLQTIHNLGYEGGVFLMGVHEWRPNNWYQYNYPEGTFYAANKIPLDPNVLIANGFIAHTFGKVYIEWGGSGKTKEKKFDVEWNKGLWFPKGSAEAKEGFPYYKKAGEETYSGYTGSTDLSAFSQHLWNSTFGQTEGGERLYLTFRIDNGDWITPEQFQVSEVVNAYHQKRGFVLSQSKNGKTAWFYLNSFADNKLHVLEVKMPDGKRIKEYVAGNGIHAKII